MPTYNGERYLAAALESICAQAEGPDEVLVVDDGSTDRTVAIAERFASRLPVRILRPTPRRNWLAMTNLGIDEVRSAWTTILHQDDLWTPGRSHDLAACLEGPASLLLMDTRFVDDAGRTLGAWKLPRSVRRGPEGGGGRTASSLYVQNWVAVPSATFRTDAAVDSGGLDEGLWYAADWDLWMKLARHGQVGCIGRYGSTFRVHGQSQTVTGSRDLDAFREQMLVVQRRHQWAALLHPSPEVVRRAGALSTETNVLLAGLLHRGGAGLRPWMDACREARAAGIMVYLRNSAVASRLRARVVLAVGGRLRPAPA